MLSKLFEDIGELLIMGQEITMAPWKILGRILICQAQILMEKAGLQGKSMSAVYGSVTTVKVSYYIIGKEWFQKYLTLSKLERKLTLLNSLYVPGYSHMHYFN